MSQPLHLVVCAFESADRAAAILPTLREWDEREEAVALANIALVTRLEDGTVHFRETADHRGEVSAIASRVVGRLSGFVFALAGTVGLGESDALGDRAEAAVFRWMKDAGFPDEGLRSVGAALGSQQSALVTLVAPEQEAYLVAELKALGGTIVTHTLDADVIRYLEGVSAAEGGERAG